jgi:dihydrofolate reductase
MAGGTLPMAGQRKIIALIAVSADGFIARRDGSFDWLDRPSPEGNYGLNAFYNTIDTILWGRKTYDVAVAMQKKGVPGAGFDAQVKNYVFTRRKAPAKLPAGVEFAKKPIKQFATALRKLKGKNIWMMGGGGLIASFLDQCEIDEFVISIIPTFIGEGIPLIAARHRTVPLKLLSCQKFQDGVVKLHYAVIK